MSKQRAKGTAFETLVVSICKNFYRDAKRNPLAGSKDVGDIHLPGETRFILECKNVKQASMPQHIREAQAEAENLNGYAVGVVVSKRHGSNDPAKQWVTLELADFLRLVRELSEPVDWMVSSDRN